MKRNKKIFPFGYPFIGLHLYAPLPSTYTDNKKNIWEKKKYNKLIPLWRDWNSIKKIRKKTYMKWNHSGNERNIKLKKGKIIKEKK